MTPAAACRVWAEQLTKACASCIVLRHPVVLEETPSTQDAPETRGAVAGTFVTAWRQTAGRGRFGRSWVDTAESGIAVTFVVDAQASERLALAGAVAAAEACECALGIRVGIKWPNDVVIDGKKVAGVLIERRGSLAAIGIGLNVTQQEFPEEIAARATSLELAARAHSRGLEPSESSRLNRLDVLIELVRALDAALCASDDTLVGGFLARDALRGTRALFATPDGPIEGEVRSVDPMRGLVVRTEQGERFLPAQSTSVAEWGGRAVRAIGSVDPAKRFDLK